MQIISTNNNTNINFIQKRSVPDLFNEYLSGQLSEGTRRVYKNDILSFFKGKEPSLEDLKQLSPDKINAWRNYVWENNIYVVSTINRKLTALNTFYEYLKAYNFINFNPVNSKLVRRIKNKGANVPQLGLSFQELKNLLKFCWKGENEAINIRDYTLILFGYSGILRPGEISNVNWGDIKKDGGRTIIHLPKSKGGANDFVPIEQKTLKALDIYYKKLFQYGAWSLNKDKIKKQAIFIALDNNCFGKRISTKSINNIIKKRAKLAKLNGVHGHTLRHSGITHLLEKNVPLHKVQELARHSDPKTTMAYNDLLGRMKDAPTNILADIC